ncbi:hypothetical protein RchiOBHm_Chr4g0408621 [Rosa chinensis]|uniref:Uncharacterized protein n=1 Tax=Rosa chinensis TaxID=74649 RepID=A0A2P6QUV9_ROSCH|nr:hypothetical protein RchiOBHm_Chr4g0408621 [Rosa chinensis]
MNRMTLSILYVISLLSNSLTFHFRTSLHFFFPSFLLPLFLYLPTQSSLLQFFFLPSFISLSFFSFSSLFLLPSFFYLLPSSKTSDTIDFFYHLATITKTTKHAIRSSIQL